MFYPKLQKYYWYTLRMGDNDDDDDDDDNDELFLWHG